MGWLNIWLVLPLYLVAINVLTYLAFRIDKLRSGKGLYRIPERTLLLLSLLGGSPAALFAQRRLRHKTRKQPFAALLAGIPVVQGFAIAGVFVWVW